jgi:hypothetical protein
VLPVPLGIQPCGSSSRKFLTTVRRQAGTFCLLLPFMLLSSIINHHGRRLERTVCSRTRRSTSPRNTLRADNSPVGTNTEQLDSSTPRPEMLRTGPEGHKDSGGVIGSVSCLGNVDSRSCSSPHRHWSTRKLKRCARPSSRSCSVLDLMLA